MNMREGVATVVMLHSSGSTPRQWKELAASLTRRFGLPVATPRLVGHDGAAPWSIPATPSLAGEVDHLARETGCEGEPIHLIGHSYGGAVAIKAALSGRFAVRSLTVYDPSLFALLGTRMQSYPRAENPKAVAESVAKALAAGEGESAARRYVDYWSGANAFEAMPAERRARMVERMEIVVACFQALFHDGATPSDLNGIEAPCLVLGGARSPAPSQDLCELVAANVPRSRHHRFAKLDHMGPLSAPAGVNPVIEEFLEMVTRETQHA